ncbi:MAG: hypothetical protein ACFFBP_04285 [Promethearchaeota archaeon]
MDKKRYYKIMFLCAAIWNWIVGLTLLILSLIAPNLFPFFGVQIPPSLVFVQMLFILVIIFGIGLFIVYLDFEQNKGIIKMVIFEKISFFVVFLIYFFLDDINFLVLLLTIIDLFFGMLFIEFLINVNKL